MTTFVDRIRIDEGVDGYMYASSEPKYCRLSTGRIIVPINFRVDVSDTQGEDRSVAMIFYSGDEGYTWQLANNSVAIPHSANEPVVCELENGWVLMSLRTRKESNLYQTISKDGGLTWAQPEPVESMVAPSSTNSIFRIPQTKDTVLFWHNYAATADKDDYVRDPLAMGVSTDNGLSYGNVKNLIEDKGVYTNAIFTGRALFISNETYLNVIDISELYSTIYGNKTIADLDIARMPNAKYVSGWLTGVSNTMCYSTDGGETWKFCGGSSVQIGEGYSEILVKDMGTHEFETLRQSKI